MADDNVQLPLCEVCGNPSTGWARDMHEIEPIRGKDGQMWANWRGDDVEHWRCDEHEYKSVSYFLDGSAWYAPEIFFWEVLGEQRPLYVTRWQRIPPSDLRKRR